MRKLLVAALLAALVVVVIPARAEANHTLAHKVKRLQAKVVKLQRKVNCQTKVPTAVFFDYGYYTPTTILTGDGFEVDVLEDALGVPNFALMWTYGLNTPADAWMIGIRNSRACRGKYPTLRDPLAARSSTASLRAKSRYLRGL